MTLRCDEVRKTKDYKHMPKCLVQTNSRELYRRLKKYAEPCAPIAFRSPIATLFRALRQPTRSRVTSARPRFASTAREPFYLWYASSAGENEQTIASVWKPCGQIVEVTFSSFFGIWKTNNYAGSPALACPANFVRNNVWSIFSD